MLLGSADTAMYAAKAAGGDRAEIFDLEPKGGGIRRLDLESDLRHAVSGTSCPSSTSPSLTLLGTGPSAWRHCCVGGILSTD